MSKVECVTLLKNARDSIRRVQRELSESHNNGSLALKGPLVWGWHAVILLAYLRLQPQRESFDTWVQDYLHEGEQSLQIERDAHWEVRERLSPLELIDLLSDLDLPILKPEFYQGWQDRTSRCKLLREKVSLLIGGSIGARQREQLMMLLAAYHRLVQHPAEVSLDPAPIRSAFPALLDLLVLLIDKTKPEKSDLLSAIDNCRFDLQKT